MIRHATAKLERQDPKVKEFYPPATKLRLSSYITDSLNSETCRMKLFLELRPSAYNLHHSTNTMFNSFAVRAMYSGARNLHVGVVLFNLYNVCFRSLSITCECAQQKLGSHRGAPTKNLPRRCHRLRKVIETSPKTSSLR